MPFVKSYFVVGYQWEFCCQAFQYYYTDIDIKYILGDGFQFYLLLYSSLNFPTIVIFVQVMPSELLFELKI